MLLSDLIRTSTFSASTILAGHEGLHRRVLSVNIMDAPDIINFLKKGELLITTAYVIKDHPEALISLVQSMHQVGCTGLAVKTKRFLQEIPRMVISEANRLGFPLIELPLNKTLGEITNESVSHILEYKTEELRYALQSHQQFSDIILQGKGMPAMINALSALLDKPVLLFNQKQELFAKSNHFQRTPYHEMYRQLVGMLPTLMLHKSVFKVCLLNPIALRGQTMTIYPIHSYQAHGLLIVLEQSDKTLSMHQLAIEQAVNVIRFEMLKTQAVKERSRRYKKEFFTDLIEERYSTEQEIIHRGSRYGLTESTPVLCVIAKKDKPPDSQVMIWRSETGDEWNASELELLYNYLKEELHKREIRGILFMKTDSVVILLKASAQTSGLETVLEEIGDKAAQQGNPISFGVGRQVGKLLETALTYREAMESLEYGYRCKKERFVQFYKGREPIDLFRAVNDKELLTYYLETLHPFRELSEPERNDLLDTLKTYYELHCHLGNTAKRLFVHRNTVIYRLNKCSQLIGRNLNSADESLRFRIAFLIKPLLQPEERGVPAR